jgi:hypothetical protein
LYVPALPAGFEALEVEYSSASAPVAGTFNGENGSLITGLKERGDSGGNGPAWVTARADASGVGQFTLTLASANKAPTPSGAEVFVVSGSLHAELQPVAGSGASTNVTLDVRF